MGQLRHEHILLHHLSLQDLQSMLMHGATKLQTIQMGGFDCAPAADDYAKCIDQQAPCGGQEGMQGCSAGNHWLMPNLGFMIDTQGSQAKVIRVNGDVVSNMTEVWIAAATASTDG